MNDEVKLEFVEWIGQARPMLMFDLLEDFVRYKKEASQ